MKTTCHRIALAAVIVTAGFSTATAIPLFYDEAVLGDVDQTYVTGALQLDVGVNRVLGTTGVSPLDFDHFAFDVPAGRTLVQALFYFRLEQDPAIDSPLTTGFSIDDDQNGFGTPLDSGGGDFRFLVSPLNLFAAVLPLGTGAYEILAHSFTAGEAWNLHYEWNLVVRPAVPEPVTSALVAIGFAAWQRRRRLRFARA